MKLKNYKIFGTLALAPFALAGCASYSTGIASIENDEYRISGYNKTAFSGDVVKTDLVVWAERFCASQIEKRQSMKAMLTQSRALDYKPGSPASAEITFKCVPPAPRPA